MLRVSLVLCLLLIAPAVRAQPAAPTIALDARSARPAMLMRLEEGRPTEKVCDAPCRAVVTPGRFVFTGPGLLPSQQFDLSGANRRVRADVSLGREDAQLGSMALLGGGGFSAICGLIVLPFAIIHAQPSDAVPTVDHNVARVLAPALLTAGIAGLIAGFTLAHESRSRLTLTPTP